MPLLRVRMINEANAVYPNALAELKNKARIFDTVCEKDGMIQVVSDFLQIG